MSPHLDGGRPNQLRQHTSSPALSLNNFQHVLLILPSLAAHRTRFNNSCLLIASRNNDILAASSTLFTLRPLVEQYVPSLTSTTPAKYAYKHSPTHQPPPHSVVYHRYRHHHHSYSSLTQLHNDSTYTPPPNSVANPMQFPQLDDPASSVQPNVQANMELRGTLLSHSLSIQAQRNLQLTRTTGSCVPKRRENHHKMDSQQPSRRVLPHLTRPSRSNVLPRLAFSYDYHAWLLGNWQIQL